MKTATSRDGTRIAYDVFGGGPPLILIGGALSFRAFRNAVELSELLAPRFSVINYDRRGRGDSTDVQPYAVQREVEDLGALVEAAGEPAFVSGLSSGAALAITAAAAGVPMRKLALFEPPYMVGTEGHRPPADHEAQLRALVAAGRRDDAVKFFMHDMIGIPRPFVWMMRLMPFWKQLRATAHTLPYDAAVMGDFTFPTSRVASIRVPTVIISGEKSPPVLRHAARAVAETLPGARSVSLAGQSHNVSMKVLSGVLNEFFGS